VECSTVEVIPFCPCLVTEYHPPECPLVWRRGEYTTMDQEAVYAAVAAHRRICELQPDLVESDARVGAWVQR
jgi:hypothetical protein